MRGYMKSFLLCGRDSKMQDIPDASSLICPKKRGSLLKLTGKGWLYAGSWKKRHCVLDGTKFYYYENERSRGTEKTCGVLNLDYYDVCEAYDTKDKKNLHVFIIGTSVRGFFDNRHQFAAETEAEMQDWIRSVHDVIAEARNIRSRAGRSRIGSDKVSPVTGTRMQVIPQMSDELQDLDLKDESPTATTQLVNATKDRVRGPQGRRLPQRKSMMPTGTSQEEDDVFKPRSFSVGGPAEEDESGDSPSENRRISLSMDMVDQTEKSDEASDNNQRSSSSYDLPNRPAEPKTAKRPIFGKLGGQHAALTKELELKLRSGLAPGGHRFHEPQPEETTQTENIEKKVESLQSQISIMQKTIESLQSKIDSINTEKSEQQQTEASEVKEILTQATSMLKVAEETNKRSELALVQALNTNDETRKVLQQLQKTIALTLAGSTAFPPENYGIQDNEDGDGDGDIDI